MTRLSNLDCLSRIINDGGFTIDKEANVYAGSGYGVSLPFSETRLPRGMATRSVIALMVSEYQDAARFSFASDNVYIGGWLDGETIYLDLTIIVDSLADALAIAAANGQVAIFDFTAGESIYVDAA